MLNPITVAPMDQQRIEAALSAWLEWTECEWRNGQPTEWIAFEPLRDRPRRRFFIDIYRDECRLWVSGQLEFSGTLAECMRFAEGMVRL